MPPVNPTEDMDADETTPLDAVNAGIAQAAEDPEEERREQMEKDRVAALWKEYEDARKFDERHRAQFAVDRRYADGTALLDWAVSVNQIGTQIDVLTSFLYARSPDVSIKKAPKVDASGTQDEEKFAKTGEIVVSALWKAPQTRMKDRLRTAIRSVLSVSIGWIKATVVCKGDNIPQLQTQLADIRDNIARLEALRMLVTVDDEGNPVYPAGEDSDDEQETLSEAEFNDKLAQFNTLQESVTKKVEVAARKMLAIDFIAAEDMQVSQDVPCVLDYLDASWCANRIYRPKEDLPAMFPGVEKEYLREARSYYQRAPKKFEPFEPNVRLTGLADDTVRPDAADKYVTDATAGGPGAEHGLEYACIVELWDKRDNHVYTMIDGCKMWAKQPYQPDYPTTRFQPYYGIGFYPTDGGRYPQSLAFRERKLQDEYCATRSSKRLTRQRAVPGIVFNSQVVKEEDARKLTSNTEQEFIPIDVPPNVSMRDLFAEKPITVGDMRLFDTTDIQVDLDRSSGVQEALQSTIQTEKTATEAEIQQTGFAARTTADRDVLECMLTELAQATLEQALSALTVQDAQRIAGPAAFWPAGMSIEDILSMVEVTIEAGTTGKPKSAQDKTAWSTLLPVLTETIGKIRVAQLQGDAPTASALTEIVKETMRRMGDDTDVDKFIPQVPQGPGMMAPPLPGGPPSPAASAGPENVPAGPPGAAPMPPDMPPDVGGVADVMAAPDLVPPELVPPELMSPVPM